MAFGRDRLARGLDAPISVLKPRLLLLQDFTRTGQEKRVQGAVAILVRGTDRVAALVGDTPVCLGTGGTGSSCSCTARTSVVRRCRALFEPMAQKQGVPLDARSPEEMWGGANADRLAQALPNLRLNTVNFPPNDGTVQLRVAIVGRGLEVEVPGNGRGVDPLRIHDVRKSCGQILDTGENELS